MSALYSLVIYLVRNGGESLDEGYLVKFKLIDATFMDWEKMVQRCLYPYI